MMRRQIYIASSWKNWEKVRELAKFLRSKRHDVFDFTDPDNRPRGVDHFTFDSSKLVGKENVDKIDWVEFLEWDETRRAFAADKAGIDWADTLILVLPCGANAHLEAGYAKGRGKDVFVFGDMPLGKYEVMYRFADGCYRANQLLDLVVHLWGLEE